MDSINLADYMTIRQAGEALRKSDKSIRRYIRQKRLTAIFIGRQYFISRESVTTLARQPIQLEDNITRRLGKVEAALSTQLPILSMQFVHLEDKVMKEFVQQLEEMATHISTLEARIQALEVQKEASPAQPSPRRRQKVDKVSRQREGGSMDFLIVVEDKSGLPSDAVPLLTFAKELGIHRGSLYEYVMKHKCPHYGIPHPKRKEVERFFDTAQREAIRVARKK